VSGGRVPIPTNGRVRSIARKPGNLSGRPLIVVMGNWRWGSVQRPQVEALSLPRLSQLFRQVSLKESIASAME